jgi:hypothetical protein
MYMLYLTIAIALSAGIGTFAAYDTQMKVNDRSNEVRAESDYAIQEQLKRALRREIQMHPDRFPTPTHDGLVEIPSHLVLEVLAGGLRTATEAKYYITGNGTVQAHVEGTGLQPVVEYRPNLDRPISIAPSVDDMVNQTGATQVLDHAGQLLEHQK